MLVTVFELYVTKEEMHCLWEVFILVGSCLMVPDVNWEMNM